MPILRTKEIRQMKPEDMNKKLSELRLELMKEKGSMKMGRASKNTKKIRQLKKAIAQILTIKSVGGKK